MILGRKIDLSSQKEIDKFIEEIRQLNYNSVYLSCHKVNDIRSIDLNKALWVKYRELANYTGHTEQEVHEQIKKIFNLKTKQSKKGELIIFGGTTTQLREEEFKKLLTDIDIHFHQKLGVYLTPYDKISDITLLNCGVDPKDL